MSANVKPTYYRLELDDYSAAAFTSFGKYYYGLLRYVGGSSLLFRRTRTWWEIKEAIQGVAIYIPSLRRRTSGSQPFYRIQEGTIPSPCAATPQGTRHFGKLQMDAYQHMGQTLLYALWQSQIRTSLACLRRGILPCDQSYVFKTTVYRNDRQVESCRNNALGIPVHSHRKPIQLLESISWTGKAVQDQRGSPRIQTPTIRSFAMTSLEMADV